MFRIYDQYKEKKTSVNVPGNKDEMIYPEQIYITTEIINAPLLSRLISFAVRSKFKGVEIVAIVGLMSNKSYARRQESLIQLILKKKGYGLESDKDSTHTLFGMSMEGSVTTEE